MKYVVTFYQTTSYVVDADDENTAFEKARSRFDCDMRRPIARTDYDDVEIEPERGEEE